MTEPNDPVMIIVGGAIALRTTQELCALQVYRVVVVSRRDPDLARAVEDAGAIFIAAARPDSAESLGRAGVTRAVTVELPQYDANSWIGVAQAMPRVG